MYDSSFDNGVSLNGYQAMQCYFYDGVYIMKLTQRMAVNAAEEFSAFVSVLKTKIRHMSCKVINFL